MKNSTANENVRFVIKIVGAEKWSAELNCNAVSESLLMNTIINRDEKFYDSDKGEKL